MTKDNIPNNKWLDWMGGVLIHNPQNDWYASICFGDGTNDPNEEGYEEFNDDPFDDYIMVSIFNDGISVRELGICGANDSDGCMMPIHRRDNPSGQIRDWFDKACDVAGIDPSEYEFVSMTD